MTVASPISRPPANSFVSNASLSALAAWEVSLASTPFSTIRSEPTFTPSAAPSLSNAMRCPVPATSVQLNHEALYHHALGVGAEGETPRVHDLAAQRILVHLAPHYGEGEVGALGGGSFGRPGRLDFDAGIREGRSRAFVYLQPGLSAQRYGLAVMALGALGCGWRERQDDECQRREGARERHQPLASVTSAGVLMVERPWEPNELLVMVLMVMVCLLFRWLAATRRPRTCCS